MAIQFKVVVTGNIEPDEGADPTDPAEITRFKQAAAEAVRNAVGSRRAKVSPMPSKKSRPSRSNQLYSKGQMTRLALDERTPVVAQSKPSSPVRFSLGRILATPGALAELEKAGQDGRQFIARHAAGDWGDVCPEDAKANDEALKDGSRIMSVFTLKTGQKLWAITEADDGEGNRICTTLLLPSEY